MILKEVKIEDIADFPETNSHITKQFCRRNSGNIPVYASSKDEHAMLGQIKDNLNGVKYYENCLSWNRNGSVGYVFVRNHKFATNEDHRAMVIKPQYKNILSLDYLKYEIQKELFRNGFSYQNKCGVDKIKSILIKIPVNAKQEYDINQQNELAIKYEKLSKIRSKIDNIKNILTVTKVILVNQPIKEEKLLTLFIPKKGDSKYTKAYIRRHSGIYPVYSSQTTDEGIIGLIDRPDYDGEYLTWTTDGIYAGTVFYRNGKFSMTTHCGALLLKEEYRGKINLKYITFQLNQILRSMAVGQGNKRVTVKILNKCVLPIPVDKDGQYNITKQNDIAGKYEKLDKIKDNLIKEISILNNASIQL
jgi:restriction endonuclease S subunit